MIRPVRFGAADAVEVWHDERGHGGTITSAHARFGARSDGAPDPAALYLACPVAGCGSVTLHHPVGDGLARREIQRLYLRYLRLSAAALGIPAGERGFAAIKARHRAMVLAADGDLGRWLVEDATADDPDP
jgi:hypothetical protein